MSLASALTGTFKNLIFFTIIILVHELGHFTIGILLKWKVDKIVIYPYGGCTKFNDSLNKSLLSEFLILIAGPIFQGLFYFFISKYLSYSNYILFKKYNGIILFFNLFPLFCALFLFSIAYIFCFYNAKRPAEKLGSDLKVRTHHMKIVKMLYRIHMHIHVMLMVAHRLIMGS